MKDDTRIRTVFYTASIGIIIIAAMLLLAVGYWVFWPDEPLVIKNPQAIKTDKREYARGETVKYTIEYCKTRSLDNNVSRYIVNGTRIAYETLKSNFPVGCHTYEVYDLAVPTFVSPGIHHIEFTYEFKVNPLRKRTLVIRTEQFMVTDKMCPQFPELPDQKFGRAEHVE